MSLSFLTQMHIKVGY